MMRLKYWARFSPANHQSQYDLCAAEYARVIGNENAARLYDRAITGACKMSSSTRKRSLSSWRDRFYAATDRPVLAEFHLVPPTTLTASGSRCEAPRPRATVSQISHSKGESLSARRRGRWTRLSTSMLSGAVLTSPPSSRPPMIISREAPAKLLSVLMKIVLERTPARSAGSFCSMGRMGSPSRPMAKTRAQRSKSCRTFRP